MTEIHPMAKKELTPIEVATHSQATSPPNVNTIFTVEPEENRNVADASKGKSKVLTVTSLHNVRANKQGSNYKTDVEGF